MKALKKSGKIIAVVFWAALIILCIIYRDTISAEKIAQTIPKNSYISIIVMLMLFALKGITVVIYGSILYAASGILFSLPLAITVNAIGTVIMTVIPFSIGKKSGEGMMSRLVKNNRKLEMLQDIQNRNEFTVSFFIRMVGLLPADLVAMYLGASGMRYRPYLLGTILGLLPAIVCFSVMGMSIKDTSCVEFIISACVEIGLMLLSVLLYFIWHRRKNRRKRENDNVE